MRFWPSLLLYGGLLLLSAVALQPERYSLEYWGISVGCLLISIWLNTALSSIEEAIHDAKGEKR